MAEPNHKPPAQGHEGDGTPRWAKVFWIGLLLFAVLFIVLHLAGGGMRGHH